MSSVADRMPLVTVAITTHNRCDFLRRSLAGVLAQSWRNLDIVVSDDASSDETPDFMASVDDPRVRYCRLASPSGIAANFQNGLDCARGEYFMILNDDDELEPEAIASLVEPFLAEPDAATPLVLSWCPCTVQDAERRPRYVTDAGPALESGLDLVAGLFDGVRGPRFCGILMLASAARAIGCSRAHGPIPDVGLWTRICCRPSRVACVQTPVARYTAHNNSCTGESTATYWRQAGEQILRDLYADLEAMGDREGLRRLRASSRNFITGLIATILMQSAARPGWSVRCLREFLRAPQYFLTPMVFRRLMREGGKIFR